MKVGKKMMRSFKRREKMSNARSPRGVCSTTIGTRAIKNLLFVGSPRTAGPQPREIQRSALPLCPIVWLRFDIGVGDEQLEGHAITQPLAQPVEVAALLHHTPAGGRRPLAGPGEPLHLDGTVGLPTAGTLLRGDALSHHAVADPR